MATFKTRARAVDMLGRQQIAGAPTAISELFKNAHDAYADRVEVDYYRSDRLFVLRDDGVGMTKEEFEARWLTIGTESKIQTKTKLGPPPSDVGKTPRPVLGEKGIGRLAIAAIGPQVLVLSQAVRNGVPANLVAAYIHWGFFEVPGVDLDEIEVPVLALPPYTPPGPEAVNEMVAAAVRTLDRIADRASPEVIEAIRADLAAMQAIDPSVVEGYVPGLDLNDGRGTHFILAAAYETVEADLDARDTEGTGDEASNLEKLLLGFTNTMTPGHLEPVIDTAFRDHIYDEVGDDLVDKDRFFTPEEFENADHHVSGWFDAYGQFGGQVSVYGELQKDYRVAWPGAQGQPTDCGPFEIHFAVVQPELKSTTLPPEDHQRLVAKTRRFGGLYVYRDGIRVLPYGDVDHDWLDIEKRRSKAASFYYFSQRNLFGAVLLSHERNDKLSEKAGREGFQQNKAYRQLRAILENLLVQVAADFFRDQGAYAGTFSDRKTELNRLHEQLKRREKSVRHKRKAFRDAIDIFFKALEADEPQTRALELVQRVEHELDAAQQTDDLAVAARRFLAVESGARSDLRDLEESYRVAKPRGVGMPQSVLRDYEAHLAAYDRLQTEVFADVRGLVDGVVSAAAAQARLNIDRRLRIERALDDIARSTRREAVVERNETQGSLEQLRSEVRGAASETIGEVEEAVTGTLAEFASTDVTALGDEAVVDLRDRLERRILDVRDRGLDRLRYVRAQLEAVDVHGKDGTLDQIEAIEQRNIDLEERAEYDLQLAQLGLAVDVINHEFDASIRSIRTSLRRLHAWADVNKGLGELYADLRSNFDHLDGYLTLFTPLHRRLNRTRTVIEGGEVARYLGDLFQPRLERHGVSLDVTPAFRRWTVEGYPSSFYPVFVNLIDNAVFWLDRQPEGRIVRLDAQGTDAFVSNNGPPIPDHRAGVIFDQGVSFKPGGRGLGLFISREALRGADYDLDFVTPRPGMNVTFRLSPQSS